MTVCSNIEVHETRWGQDISKEEVDLLPLLLLLAEFQVTKTQNLSKMSGYKSLNSHDIKVHFLLPIIALPPLGNIGHNTVI